MQSTSIPRDESPLFYILGGIRFAPKLIPSSPVSPPCFLPVLRVNVCRRFRGFSFCCFRFFATLSVNSREFASTHPRVNYNAHYTRCTVSDRKNTTVGCKRENFRSDFVATKSVFRKPNNRVVAKPIDSTFVALVI